MPRMSKAEHAKRNKAICAAYLAGGTLVAVGEQFGVSVTCVQYTLCQSGIAKTKRLLPIIAQRREAGETLASIGEDFHLTGERIRQLYNHQDCLPYTVIQRERNIRLLVRLCGGPLPARFQRLCGSCEAPALPLARHSVAHIIYRLLRTLPGSTKSLPANSSGYLSWRQNEREVEL